MNKILAVLLAISILGYVYIYETKTNILGSTTYSTSPTFVVASSTSFTLTTSSQRILATSTPTRRIAVTVQPVNCTTANGPFLSLRGDIAATSATGLAVFASTTMQFETNGGIPVVQGSVQAITGAGTCTVLVTEWRSQY